MHLLHSAVRQCKLPAGEPAHSLPRLLTNDSWMPCCTRARGLGITLKNTAAAMPHRSL